MKKHILIISLGLLSTFGIAQQKDVKDPNLEIEKILSQEFKSDESGATVLVARKGEILYKKAFGMADLELNVPMQADNVFRIGSITKQFTAVAILQLMEKGKLSLQDDITKFIPEFPTKNNKITIEHLLTHTSGIPSYTSMKDYRKNMAIDMDPNKMIALFKDLPLDFEPGTQWKYSNSGYFLLGYIIEKASGKTYPEYITENIFKPAGMSNSLYGSDKKIIKNRSKGYSKGPDGYENALALSMTQPYSAGSIQSTVEDLFKWNQALNSNKMVKKESLDKAFTNYKLSNGKDTDYGYGWSLANVQGSPSIEHGGAINGFLSMELYLPKEDVFVAVLTNCDCKSPEALAVKLAGITIGKPYEYNEMVLSKDALTGYEGVFENEKGEQRIISISDNKLYSQRGRNQKLNIRPYQKDKFFFEDGMNTMEFSRTTKGDIDALIMTSRDGNEIWKKTDKALAVKKEIKLDAKILDAYVGEYEIVPEFTFKITKEQDRLFTQATGQEKCEIFPETETKFFLKVVDAELEFVKDDKGTITKAILKQNGRQTDAKKKL